jgi:hypothetical protein
VVDRASLKVVLGHPEALLDAPQRDLIDRCQVAGAGPWWEQLPGSVVSEESPEHVDESARERDCGLRAENVIGTAQCIPHLCGLRGGDRQRLGLRPDGQSKIQLGLPGSQPLGSGSFECGHPSLITRLAEVLDLA